MKKTVFAIFLALNCIFAITAAGKSEQPKLKIGVLNGPSGIPCAYLMQNKSSLEKKSGRTIEFDFFSSAQLELPALLKGETQIGFLPPNAAAKVYNSSNGALIVLGVCGNGNLYLISKDSGYKSFSDLKGKTVACAGQGATPEYMFKYLLSKSGVETGDKEYQVNLDFSIPNASIAAAVLSGKAEYALVPEPFASVACMKDPSVKRIADLSKEFAAIENGASFPMTVLVANKKFVSENRKVLNAFLKEYKVALKWTLENPDAAGKLVEQNNFGLKAEVAANSIPNGAYVWKDAGDSKADIERLLNIFLDFAPESIGAKLPDQGFYYK